jgi:hypothetical protein
MNIKRMRGRNHRGNGSSGVVRHHQGGVPLNRNHVFDSSGPDLRVRGTAQQLYEKYIQLGRDAASAGDRVMAESYFQYGEHYFRILNAMAQAAQPNGTHNPPPRRPFGSEAEEAETPPGTGEQPVDPLEASLAAAAAQES